MWFHLDDWEFLVDRRANNLGDLFRSHNGHWVTLPVLLYRALWFVLGIRSYLPYQVFVVAAHLGAAALLRVVMRRAGVRPWTATVVAAAFVLFGRGHENILAAFQVTMVGSLVFGLVHLILADHDGGIDRRDVAGMVCGLFGLMCSGVGVPLVIGVGLATLLRRGWRVAALHVIPLGLVYLIWWEAIGQKAATVSTDTTSVAGFAAKTAVTTFADVGDLPGAGVAIGLVLVVGFTLAWFSHSSPFARRELAAPTGLLGAGVALLVITAVGRASVTDVVQGRYEHLLLALTLPALAVAVDAIGIRYRTLLVPLLALILVGTPGNIRAAYTFTRTSAARTEMAQYRRTILTLPRLPIARTTPRTLTPETVTGFRITMGWLLDGVKSGRIPAPPAPNAGEIAVDTLRLSLLHSPSVFPTEDSCRQVHYGPGAVVTLATGEAVFFRRGANFVRILPVRGPGLDALPFELGREAARLLAVRPVGFRVVIDVDSPARVATVCTPRGDITTP
ncbi:MAG: hypothetical protein JWM72_150 [Actinomycetia bacterium]|jgi:hypothetical protein|nr:hypothetical protein [Actinomycetes bacterium]